MNIIKYNTIILDCDGVIVNSNLLKIEAYRRTLKKYDSRIVDDFLNYFKNNFGTSRYKLTETFIVDFLKIKLDKEIYDSIISDFGKHCIELYLNVDYTKSFLEFLEKFGNKKLYVASGSDETELNNVFKEKNILNRFEKVLGSPRKKTELIEEILKDNDPKTTIMIGDALSDFLASKNNQIHFIFMSDYSLVSNEMMKLRKKEKFNTINNLGDLI